MEVDFDKEIDALMRSSGGGRTITISEFTAPHIDADTLNAFAENALPDAARKGYMTHLADCDGCRKTLSSLILMNAEAEPVSAVSTIPAIVAETSVPWYTRLFAVQNLAYGMGALVLVFAGVIGYTVLQNTGMRDAATVSQVGEQERGRGPMASDSEGFAANTTSSNTATALANTNASTAVSANKQVQPAELAKGGAANTIVGEEVAIADDKLDQGIAVDGASVAPPPPPAAAAPVTKPAPKEARPEDDLAVAERKDKSTELKVLRQEEQMPSAGNMPSTQAGPSRNIQRDNRASGDRESAKKRAITSPALGRVASPSKTVGGKNFSKRDNVWYDSSYSGQGTTNVRRGTEGYRKLDSGLRTIAESLDGVVVVVWRSKAYRIQ